jgi:predicted enzyme related to lactoylglutathione lyase
VAKAVGVGGVFLRARDPRSLAAWYREQPGITATEDGSLIFDGPDAASMTVFAHFPEDTEYFGRSQQRAMINFRVDSLDQLLAQLEVARVPIDPARMNVAYGRFAWIEDPEGNRVELWEPVPAIRGKASFDHVSPATRSSDTNSRRRARKEHQGGIRSIQMYQRLEGKRRSIVDALSMPGLADIQFDPPRSRELARPADVS